MAERQLERCKYCSRLFFLAPTVASGGEKRIPLDPLRKPFEPEPAIAPNVILELNGWARVLRRSEMDDATLQPRYVPHYASCQYSRKVRDRNERRRRRLELEDDQDQALREEANR